MTERAKEAVKSALVYQAIYEDAGLSIDMEAVIAEMTEENGEEYVTNMKETYGEDYKEESGMYTYTKEGTRLMFLTQENIVTSIEYSGLTE